MEGRQTSRMRCGAERFSLAGLERSRVGMETRTRMAEKRQRTRLRSKLKLKLELRKAQKEPANLFNHLRLLSGGAKQEKPTRACSLLRARRALWPAREARPSPLSLLALILETDSTRTSSPGLAGYSSAPSGPARAGPISIEMSGSIGKGWLVAAALVLNPARIQQRQRQQQQNERPMQTFLAKLNDAT